MHKSATVTFISSTNEPESLCLAAKCAQLTWEVADVTQNKETSVWSRKAPVQNQRESIYAAVLVGCFTQRTSLWASPRSLPVALNCRILTVSQSEGEPLKSSCVDNLASDSGFAAPQHSHVAAHQQSVSLRCYTFFFSLPLFSLIPLFFLCGGLRSLHYGEKAKKVNWIIKPCHSISNQTSGSGRISIRVHKHTHVGP